MKQTNDNDTDKSLEWLQSQQKPKTWAAPDGYFDQLHGRVQHRIHQQPQVWYKLIFKHAINYKIAIPVAACISLLVFFITNRQPPSATYTNNITIEDVLNEGYDVHLQTNQIAEVMPEDLSFQEFDSEEMLDYLNVQDVMIEETIDSIEL